MKKNVLLLCHNYAVPFLSVARQYVKLFDDSNYNVVTVFLKQEESQEAIEQCAPSEVIFCDYSTKDIRGLKRKPVSFMRQLHEKYNFEFCIAHRYKSIYIATHIKDLFVIGICHIDSVFNKWTRRRYIYGCNNLNILGVSKAIRDDARKSLTKMDSNRIQHLYNCLEFDNIRNSLLSREEARQKLGLNEDDFLFANVGRLHEDKDQKTLIKGFAKAAEEMPKAKLCIAGAGRLESDLKKQVASAGLDGKVIFLGMVPEVRRYLKAFDSFVLTSIREGLPVAMLEAFAAELICCASLCNGSTEAIEGVGYSFPIGDDSKLSECLREIYTMVEEQKKDLVQRMNDKIDSSFTQNAVNNSFWQLDFMQEYKFF